MTPAARTGESTHLWIHFVLLLCAALLGTMQCLPAMTACQRLLFTSFRGETPVAAGRCPALHTGMRPNLSLSLNKKLLALLDYCVCVLCDRVRVWFNDAWDISSYTAASACRMTSLFFSSQDFSPHNMFCYPLSWKLCLGICVHNFFQSLFLVVCVMCVQGHRERHRIEDGWMDGLLLSLRLLDTEFKPLDATQKKKNVGTCVGGGLMLSWLAVRWFFFFFFF